MNKPNVFVAVSYWWGACLCLCLNACSVFSTSQQTIQGTFRSTQGVMVPISCYCANGGYITQKDGKEIPICLKENQAVSCEKIMVKGRYQTRKPPTEPTTPCPPEPMRIFEVQKITCENKLPE